jgi:hypothetical protein
MGLRQAFVGWVQPRAHAHILEDILGYFVHLLHQSDILIYYNRFGYTARILRAR